MSLLPEDTGVFLKAVGPRQNGRHIADGILISIFSKFEGQINNMSSGDKSLPEPVMTHFADTGLIVGLCPAIKRRRYKVTPSLIGWPQTYIKSAPRNIHHWTPDVSSLLLAIIQRQPIIDSKFPFLIWFAFFFRFVSLSITHSPGWCVFPLVLNLALNGHWILMFYDTHTLHCFLFIIRIIVMFSYIFQQN